MVEKLVQITCISRDFNNSLNKETEEKKDILIMVKSSQEVLKRLTQEDNNGKACSADFETNQLKKTTCG